MNAGTNRGEVHSEVSFPFDGIFSINGNISEIEKAMDGSKSRLDWRDTEAEIYIIWRNTVF